MLANGVPVPLSAKALDILTVLVEARGDLVTTDELLARVWPKLIVDAHNVQVHISALRRALGDDAHRIQTVSRRGYRFIDPVETEAAPAALLLPSSASPPRPLGRLFGREKDLATIRSLLERSRLVTIVGPGGIGKTRVGLELAHELRGRYREGVVFVDLSVLQDPSLTASVVATAIGIEFRGDTPQAEQLARRLKEKELLILLDNCEHVVDTVALLAERVLTEAAGISLLATSREPLACPGEQVYRLPLLPVPTGNVDNAQAAMSSPSVALLIDRAQAADLRFALTDASSETASAICRRLDGLPLAIEMVGALVPGLGLTTLAAQLEEKLRLPYSITRTIAPRHQSLATTLDWSYALLSPTERVLLRRLSVFPGSFSLATIEAVVCDETLPRLRCGEVLAGLVRKSLVSTVPAPPSSYRLLQTIRAYAGGKLDESGEQNLLSRQHALHVADMLERAMQEWETTADTDWLNRIGWLLSDLRVSLGWSFGPNGDNAIGLALVGRMWPLWQILNLIGEGRRWADVGAERLTDETPALVAARVWFAVGYLNGVRSLERSVSALRKAETLFVRANDPIERGAALAVLGQMLAFSDTAAVDSLIEARALLMRGTHRRWLGTCAMAFGMQHTNTKSWSEARREYKLAQDLFRSVGAKRLETAALSNLANAMWAEGSLMQAIETTREALAMARREGQPRHIGHTSGNLAGMLTDRGDLDEALAIAREAVPLCREDEYLYWLFPHLALRVGKAGRPQDAARLLGYTEHLGTVRQINERRALETLKTLLNDQLTPDRNKELLEAGRYLNEDQAIALALG
ncbi:MAG TPA: winged helix-turn-helix domain-containing protein [Aliidongia sp.]|nr:winged helix-turn-helix domain-containing protein [Aliidongia sp.]